MLAPEPTLVDVLCEQWPIVVVVLITAIKIVRGLDLLRKSFERDFCHAVERAAARGAHEAQQEAAHLRQENAWLKAQLAHEGPGAGFRKAAPPPQTLSTRAPEKPGRDTRKG